MPTERNDSLKNRNASRLLREMKRLSMDINDQEICKKFETLLKGGNDMDIPQAIMSQLLIDPADIDEKQLPELYLMYFRHFRFQRKREERMVNRGEVKPRTRRTTAAGS